MRPVAPPGSGGRLARTVAACLAAILEIAPDDVPLPEEGHPDPWRVWRDWLAQRRVGLVPIAEPSGFSWPGPWLALLRAADGDGQLAAVAFGSPPGIAWHPLGGPEDFAALEAGYVLAPADVALWTPGERPAAQTEGVVEAIVVAADAEAPLVAVETVQAVAGRGLEGDRYHAGRGTFTNAHGRGHDLTLIDADALAELGITAEDARRNVVTRGIDLDALVGRPFRIGAVECFGQRLCEPCAHLERLAPGTLRPLIHRGGLRADVVTGGEIRVGDAIVAG